MCRYIFQLMSSEKHVCYFSDYVLQFPLFLGNVDGNLFSKGQCIHTCYQLFINTFRVTLGNWGSPLDKLYIQAHRNDYPIRFRSGGNADYAMDMHQKEQLHDNAMSMMQSQHFNVG